MINLLPPEAKKIIVREYVLHVVATFAFLFGTVAIVLAVGCIPTYVLVNAQIATLAHESEKESDEKQVIEKINQEISKTNEILAQLKSTTVTIRSTQALAELTKMAPEGISFKTFTFSDQDSMQVQGVAEKRDVLVRFKKDIEADVFFETAEIPIADLAKDTDLPFVMKVTFAKNK